MTAETLTKEQKAFLEETNLEFSDRFTDADLEYKKVYDDGIPPPPVMYPWYVRNRPSGNRNSFPDRNNRAGGSRYDDNRGERNENSDRDRGYRNRGYRDRYANRHQHDRYSDRNSRDGRYRPY